jgi:hypothetical protein
VEGLQDGVERLRAFCAVQDESPLRALDELGLARLEDARGAGVLGLAEYELLASCFVQENFQKRTLRAT